MRNTAVLQSRGKIVAALVIALTLAATVAAQNVPVDQLPQQAFTMPLNQPLPADARATVGKLDNGLTYYIRENKEPKNRAELRLVVNTGSNLENDNQLGLAHVLEHMAFNGTEHFPKQNLISFMESIGMRFGSDLNASTSFDETIYNLQVPTDKPEQMDTALQIMEDWTHALTLNPTEIDQERGVVMEEWRRGQGARQRVQNQQLPVLLKDSRYAIRLPIGTPDSIQHFDQQALRQFYQDWYRPDLMAVVAVGDFDKAAMEKLIKQHFAGIPAAKAPKQRSRYEVPSHEGTLFSIVADPEIPNTSVTLVKILPPVTDWTPAGYRQSLVEGLYNAMLNQRFGEMARQPNAAFLVAQSGRGALVRTASAYQLVAAVQETGIKRGLETLLVEAEKVKRFGFTQAEFDRVKTARQRGLEQLWASRNNLPSAAWVGEIIRNYLTGEAITGPEFEIALTMRFLNTITLAEVNQIGKDWVGSGNRVVTVTMPQKAGLTPPTEDELREVLANAAKADIKPNVETINDAPLVSSAPKGSPVTRTRALKGDITEWTLGNGVKVVIKSTDFQKDEIVFNGVSSGGTSLAGDDDYITADAAVSVIANGGLGNFTAIDLQRKLTGKVARVSPYISDYQEGIQGGGSPADLETLMQLIYLRFTAPRADATFYQVFQTQMSTSLQNRLASPDAVFSDAVTRLMYQNHARRQPPSLDMLKHIDLGKSLAFYQDRFRDAGDFSFVFTGNIDLKTFQPLAEIWLGGLPSTGRKESWKDVGIRLASGVREETVRSGKEAKASTRIVYTGHFEPLNIQQRMRLGALSDILENRLREVLREKLGGTYSVNVGSQTNIRPDKSYALNISFGSAPERVEELVTAVYAEIDKLKQEGPTDMELSNQQATMKRSHESGLRQNSTWMAQLVFAYTNEVSNGIEDYLDYDSNVDKLTAASLRDGYRQFFNNDNRLRATLLPENK